MKGKLLRGAEQRMGETSKWGGGGEGASDRSAVTRSGTFSEPTLPRTLNERYRLEALIAKGGMGRVYRATQLPLERSVAVKVLVPPPNVHGDFRQRFLLEASICAKLAHPNIVVVHDYGESETGDLFMAMELLDGEPLKELIAREGPLPPERAARVAMQVARALRAAHREGVAHRDLKPGNVFVLRESLDEDAEPDAVKVLDFGLVKVFEEDRADVEEDLTDSEMVLGSPRYMSPEQILCEPVDARADIYSFGACLFAMLTGRPPFLGRSPMEVLTQHLRRPTPRLAEVFDELSERPAWEPPAALDAIVQRCMQKHAEDRYATIDEVIGALKEAGPADANRTGAHDALASSSGVRVGSLGLDSDPELDLDADAEPEGRRGAPWLAVLVLLGLGGLLAALAVPRFLEDERPVAPAPVADPPPALEPPAATTARVTITSEPSGAEVSSGGVRLGVTPLTRELPHTPEGASQVFQLRLEGYEPGEARHALLGDEIEVHVALRPTLPPEPEAPVEATPEPAPRVRRQRPRRPRAESEAAPPTRRSSLVDERRTRIPVVD